MYVTLISKASLRYFPDNSPASFHTKLPEDIVLNPSEDWEVGLVEVILPSVDQLKQNTENYWVQISTAKKRWTYNISIYDPSNVELVLQTLTNATLYHKKRFTVTYDPANGVFHLKVKGDNTRVVLSSNLANAMNMERGTYNSGDFHGLPKKTQLKSDHNFHAYIYSDMCEMSMVGHSWAPLMRIINLDQQAKGPHIFRFKRVFYHKLKSKTVSTIHVNIRDEFGQLLPFGPGSSILTLHLRQRQ